MQNPPPRADDTMLAMAGDLTVMAVSSLAEFAPLSITATLFNIAAFNIAPANITALYIIDNGFTTPPLETDMLAAGRMIVIC